MKKLLALLLALAMSCSVLASCSNSGSSTGVQNNETSQLQPDGSLLPGDSEADPSGDGSEDPSGDDGSSYISITLENETPKETDERLYEGLMSRIAETGVYTVNVNTEAFNVYITTDGENTYVDFLGIAVLSNASGDHMIDKEGKRYYLDASGESGEANILDRQMLGIFTATEGMTYSSTSTATIIGKEYTVEKYINSETGETFSYVFDAGGDLAFVGGGENFIPLDFIDRADTSKFSLDGYTEMTQEEYLDWFFGEQNAE